jgi:uncharacterized protein (TIGR03083 family)
MVVVTTISRCMGFGNASDARAHYRQAATGFVEILPALGHDDWGRPALGEWTVRDLAGHTSRALLTVESYLDPQRRAEQPSIGDASAYYRAASAALADPAAVAERGRQAGAALGDRPAEAVAAIAERVLALVDGSPDDALVTTPVGTMTLTGYLPSRTFELVVHGLDLVAATGAAVPARLTGALPACVLLAAQQAVERGDGVDALLALTGRRALPAGFSVV